jgi:hypothetical protein
MRELTAYANGGTNLKEIGLRKENLPGVDAELTDLPLRELHLLPTSPFQQPPYYIIQYPLIHHPLHCHHHHLLHQITPKRG